MPYEWVPPKSPNIQAELHAWPYRSLPRKGFVVFIAASVAIIAIPMSAIIGTAVLWAVLPFFILVIAGVWWAIERSYRDGAILEILTIAQDQITLHHHAPGKPPQDWQANPYWVRPELHRSGSKIEKYLTLSGGPRVVELGAFLTPDEREQIYYDLNDRLAQLYET